MIEQNLIQYGVLGLWTATLLGERYYFQKGLTKALQELTEVIKNL